LPVGKLVDDFICKVCVKFVGLWVREKIKQQCQGKFPGVGLMVLGGFRGGMQGVHVVVLLWHRLVLLWPRRFWRFLVDVSISDER